MLVSAATRKRTAATRPRESAWELTSITAWVAPSGAHRCEAPREVVGLGGGVQRGPRAARRSGATPCPSSPGAQAERAQRVLQQPRGGGLAVGAGDAQHVEGPRGVGPHVARRDGQRELHVGRDHARDAHVHRAVTEHRGGAPRERVAHVARAVVALPAPGDEEVPRAHLAGVVAHVAHATRRRVADDGARRRSPPRAPRAWRPGAADRPRSSRRPPRAAGAQRPRGFATGAAPAAPPPPAPPRRAPATPPPRCPPRGLERRAARARAWPRARSSRAGRARRRRVTATRATGGYGRRRARRGSARGAPPRARAAGSAPRYRSDCSITRRNSGAATRRQSARSSAARR